jgi:putative transposase
MPEHVHLLILPTINMKLGLVIREIKSRSAREYFKRNVQAAETVGRKFWMVRCYDHNCRSELSVQQKKDYCHWNPVKRGLVENPDQYRWSSYRAYSGVGRVPLEVDSWEMCQ